MFPLTFLALSKKQILYKLLWTPLNPPTEKSFNTCWLPNIPPMDPFLKSPPCQMFTAHFPAWHSHQQQASWGTNDGEILYVAKWLAEKCFHRIYSQPHNGVRPPDLILYNAH